MLRIYVSCFLVLIFSLSQVVTSSMASDLEEDSEVLRSSTIVQQNPLKFSEIGLRGYTKLIMWHHEDVGYCVTLFSGHAADDRMSLLFGASIPRDETLDEASYKNLFVDFIMDTYDDQERFPENFRTLNGWTKLDLEAHLRALQPTVDFKSDT